MRVAVFADMHAHAEALEAVLAAASGFDELWSLGDMVGTGPDPCEVVARVRAVCRVALIGNHDYLALRDGEANPSILHARAALDDDAMAWMRSRKPASRRGDEVQMWHGGPHNAVHEFVGPRNADSCLERQRAPIGLVGHTHVPAAFSDRVRRVRIAVGEPLDISDGKWLLNPGAVYMPSGVASWLSLDLAARTATWMEAPFDPAPAAERARRLGFAP
ncbi:metallophosphoesterase family protein [Solirubrobacter soli]|uniref:metallophosphoesterase family protein n=1 Tax=Solirubrobacter soli TaxID=363832 RepID=UPI0009FD9A83|nr:metallophosphoesterase family protein [Solirubrobacter soli]